jgi:soluble lytic murein transglycosylase-like protein
MMERRNTTGIAGSARKFAAADGGQGVKRREGVANTSVSEYVEPLCSGPRGASGVSRRTAANMLARRLVPVVATSSLLVCVGVAWGDPMEDAFADMENSISTGDRGAPSSVAAPDDFESWKRNQQREQDAWAAQQLAEYEEFKRAYFAALDDYKKEIRQYWDDAEVTDKTHWVEYAPDLKTKRVVDYEANEIRISFLGAPDSTPAQLQQAIQKEVKSVLVATPNSARQNDPVLKAVKLDAPSNDRQSQQPVLSELLADKPTSNDLDVKAAELAKSATVARGKQVPVPADPVNSARRAAAATGESSSAVAVASTQGRVSQEPPTPIDNRAPAAGGANKTVPAPAAAANVNTPGPAGRAAGVSAMPGSTAAVAPPGARQPGAELPREVKTLKTVAVVSAPSEPVQVAAAALQPGGLELPAQTGSAGKADKKPGIDAGSAASTVQATASFDNDETVQASEKQEPLVVTIKLPPQAPSQRAAKYASLVQDFADKNELKPALVYAIIHTESAFNPMARSEVPAYGLMQIVPESAGRDAAKKVLGQDRILSPEYLYNAKNNVEAGAAYFNILYYSYLKGVVDPLSRLYCAIAAYNTGVGNVAKAFAGTMKLRAALPKINDMKPQQVYDTLLNSLPYDETRKYLQKVVDRQKLYENA